MAGGEARQAGNERALFLPPSEDVAVPFAAPAEESEAAGGGSSNAAASTPWFRIFAWFLGRRPGLGSPGGRADIRSRLAAAALVEWERGTGFLFAPVSLCLGALLYFTLDVEPAFSELGLTAVLLATAVFVARASIVARHMLLGLMLVALGMGAAKFETWRASTKMLGGEISTRVTGRVAQIEHRANGRVRLTIDVVATERPELRYSPDRIRATARSIPETIVTGGGVTGIVSLRQPSGPVRPGSYDFSFHNYFEGIGASGFFYGSPSPAQLEEPAPMAVRVAAWLERLRNGLAAHIRSTVGGPEGAIAAALITGVTASIPEDAKEAMRISGIYHVISISGLHLALVAGTVMVSVRAALALFPGFASRRPVRKYAAAAALVTVFFYLFLSGAEVATQRSFIMLAVMLLALVFDRAALTMRNLAIAAMIVIAISPHEVVGPSFQMSFAATAALIAAYAAWSERRRGKQQPPANRSRAVGLFRLGLLYAGGIAMTSIVAGSATALFGAWHFNRVAPLGLLANLLAMPVVSFVVMPFALLAMLLMPLGLDNPALAAMGWGIAVMMAIAEWVAAQSPFDVVGMVPVAAVLFFCVALVLLTMTTTALRIAALPALVAGVLVLAARDPPDVLVAEDGRLVALRLGDDLLAVNRARPNGFTTDNWRRATAAADVVKPIREDVVLPAAASAVLVPIAPQNGFRCSETLCLARHASGAMVAHAADARAALPVCGVAALIVIDDATASANICAGKSAVITKRDTARRGSAEARFRQTPASISAAVRFAIGEPYRPWHGHRAFSRAARGMPPYRRPESDAKPATGGEAAPVAEEESATEKVQTPPLIGDDG